VIVTSTDSGPLGTPLKDGFGRVHDNLRISVTDRCNIRCFYCMPEEGVKFMDRAEILTFEEIERFVRAAVPLGISKLRLTGGEPLLRRDLPRLIEKLAVIPGIRDIALTTNAVLLEKQAADLYRAGLRRLNIHLDTLDRARFERITRRDDLPKVLAGIDAAVKAGFQGIKLNIVAVRGLVEPDIVPMAQYCRERGFEPRYIEFMPLDAQSLWERARVLTADEIRDILSREIASLKEVPDADPRAPATEYEYADGGGRVGFIASVSKPFCLNCNRIRLTSEGKLRYCLFAIDETDVRPLLRSKAPDEEIAAAIRGNIAGKWIGHEINSPKFVAPPRPMYSIGG
jgi:cyclic pyranopterin phosphate synthase